MRRSALTTGTISYGVLLDLFSPETWQAFHKHGACVSGFRERQRATAGRIKPGDILLCYLVRLSRWCGALEVTSPAFHDTSPIFSDPDPFSVRFKVRPIVALDPEHSIPIFDDQIWGQMEETRDLKKGVRGWAVNYRGSLRLPDGTLLQRLLQEQGESQAVYPLTDRDQRQLVHAAQGPDVGTRR